MENNSGKTHKNGVLAKANVKTVGKGMVPRAGVEPARPFGQRILSPLRGEAAGFPPVERAL